MSAPFQPIADDAAFDPYLARLAAAMQHESRRQPLHDYCTGLLLPDGRKSVEPIAARLAPATARTKHKTLLTFVSEGAWSDTAVLTAMHETVLPAIEAHGPVRFWITDETSMAKKGERSVGVARQYCGELGKVENCQVMVTLSVATDVAGLPIAARLYLPEEWIDHDERRAKARIPLDVGFRPNRPSRPTRSAPPTPRAGRPAWGPPTRATAAPTARPAPRRPRRGGAARRGARRRGLRLLRRFPAGCCGVGPGLRRGRALHPGGSAAAGSTPRPSLAGRNGGDGADAGGAPAALGLALGEVARGERGGPDRAGRYDPGARRPGRRGGRTDPAGGMADRRPRPERLLARHAAARHALGRGGRHGQGAVVGGAGLPRPEAGGRPRRLRGPRLARLPPPCHTHLRRLWLPRDAAVPDRAARRRSGRAVHLSGGHGSRPSAVATGTPRAHLHPHHAPTPDHRSRPSSAAMSVLPRHTAAKHPKSRADAPIGLMEQ